MEFNATFFVSIISFLVFTFIMNKIFYAPLNKIICVRDELVSKNYADSDEFNKNASEILEERDRRLADADGKSVKILADKLDEANLKSKEVTDSATAQSKARIGEEFKNLHLERDLAHKQLQNDVVGLAELISSKVMGVDVEVERKT